MPPYFSIEMAFPYKFFYPSLVRDLYDMVFSKFPFKSGYWNSEGESLEEIIVWNQRLLEKRFRLGFYEPAQNNYKQVLLLSNLYSEMRLFWMYTEDEIRASIIIPEYDVLVDEDIWTFDAAKIEPIKNLCEHLWTESPVEHIQTCLEMDGGPISMNKIKKGSQPSIRPISIVRDEDFEKMGEFHSSIEVISIKRSGFLFINRNHLAEV
ncbi:hypothetical protein WMW72_07345 [Paenibacillus filicis]|uniref:Uncharacterized protein n=1 Tax=Paenibacillus filicis TaxID=669464 RepID=A0ABU9DFS6_9BACL